MKTKLNPSQNSGSALVVTLFLITILAISIAGYLAYTNQQTRLGVRSQTWNMALAVSEAGVEEGLEQLNNNYSNLSNDGWTGSGTIYSISRSFPNGSSYTVSIDYSNSTSPTITSRAFVNPPALAQNAPTVFFAAAGTTTTTTDLTRAIRVQTSRGSILLAAMVARHKIDMNGNNILTDSFDSGDTTKSTNGQYDATKAGDYGSVASNDGVTNTVSGGNANIYGKVITGPGGSATVGVNGAVGEHTWQASNTGIEPGYVLHNANFTFPSISLPYNSGLTPGPEDIITISGYSNGTNNSTTYTAVANPPGALSAGQTLGPITTNINSTTSSTYPGSQPGMTTNTTWQTVGNYPGSQPQLTTNYIGFVTVSTHPGAQPQITTNCSSTVLKVKTKPAVGVYCGTAPWQTGNDVNWWYYYPVASYTYANQFSYTYATYTYGYTTKTYTYVVYNSTPLYTTNHYDHVLYTGEYYTSDLSGTTLVVGNARLVMPNGLSMSGNDQVTIAQSGSLALYSGGNSLTIGGNGVLNKSGYAANFIAYATPSVTSMTLNGNGTFIGILVAPEANTTMNGGGSTVYDFIGALLVNSVKMNGHFKFHYDEALSRIGGNGRFLITSWDEIP